VRTEGMNGPDERAVKGPQRRPWLPHTHTLCTSHSDDAITVGALDGKPQRHKRPLLRRRGSVDSLLLQNRDREGADFPLH